MSLPRRYTPPSEGPDPNSDLWLRLSAFLSLRSPNTQVTYLGIIREWCEFLGAKPGTEQAASLLIAAKDMHAIAYKSWLEARPGEVPRGQKRTSPRRELEKSRTGAKRIRAKKSGLESTLANATISKKFAALRRIYRMLMGCGFPISNNPFDTDAVPPPPKNSGRKRPTEMLDFNSVMRVVQSADAANAKGRRDRAILAVLFGGALRRSEASNLRIGDVRRTASGTTYLYLRATKAKKDAEQALPGWAAEFVKLLVAERRQDGAADEDHLFISYSGQAGNSPTNRPVSGSGIYKLFKHYCSISGAGHFVSPHSARATAITKLLADGVPYREVQEFSRHSSVQMVELYDKRRIGVDQNPGRKLSYD